MGVKVAKYIDLQSRYAKYGEDGYFIEPNIIGMMLFDALKLKNVEEFVGNASITITEEEIKTFLDKLREEEQPGLKQKLAEEMKTGSTIILTDDEENFQKKMKASAEKMKDMMAASRYYFEPYSLQYFKIYISRLKEKLQSLCSILDDIKRSKTEELPEESKQRLTDLDFHVGNGTIYYKDAERLVDCIISNVKDLQEKIRVGNNPETYLTFKESRHQLMKDDVWESDLYPSKKIQIRDRYYAYRPEFIALSEGQQTQLQKEELQSFSKWMKMDFDMEDEMPNHDPQLVKTMKSNEE